MATILITGTSGYIGKRFAAAVEAAGHIAVAPSAGDWRLDDEPHVEMFSGVDAVVHLAHSWRGDTAADVVENINLLGSERLARAASRAGVKRFVFVSSVSADPAAPNIYGRVKHATETSLLASPHADLLVVCARVGLVYGGDAAGQYGVMRKLVRLSPVLPMMGLRKQVQPIHIDKICEGLLALAAGRRPRRPLYVLASPRPMAFANWLRLLRRAETGGSLLLIPLPFFLGLLTSRLLAVIPFAPKLDRERILGLAGTRFRESKADLDTLKLVIGDPGARLISPRFACRGLLREAIVLLYYLLGHSPPPGPVLRLARLLRQQDETALDFPSFIPWRPGLLRFFDPRDRQTALARHLQMAAMVTETLPHQRRLTPARALMEFVWEAMAFPVRLAAGHLIG